MDRRSFLRKSSVLALVGATGCLGGYTAERGDRTPTETLSFGSTTTEGETPIETQTRTPTRTRTSTETATATPEGPTTTPGPGETTTEDPTPTATPTRTETATPTETATTTEASLPSQVTVEVGKGGAFFVPRTFRLAKGGTVKWVWVGNDHNVVVKSQPSGADWSGTSGPDSKTYNSGHTYSYTFDVPGRYDYYCFQHDQYGMTGAFLVR